jgi:hypothetical protein
MTASCAYKEPGTAKDFSPQRRRDAEESKKNKERSENAEMAESAERTFFLDSLRLCVSAVVFRS